MTSPLKQSLEKSKQMMSEHLVAVTKKLKERPMNEKAAQFEFKSYYHSIKLMAEA